MDKLEGLNWIPFDARNAAEVAYSEGSVYVRWAKGGTGRYDGVPQAVWDKLASSGGSGKVFVDLVRSRFGYVRLE